MTTRTALMTMVLTVLLLGACASGGPFDRGPDLVPERRPGGQGAEGFCDRPGDGTQLRVRVRNQGNEDALTQTTTIVVFSPGGPRSTSTPPLAAGAPTELMVDIPSGCFNPDCDFDITVDANDDVDELRHNGSDTSHEDNNSAGGTCIG